MKQLGLAIGLREVRTAQITGPVVQTPLRPSPSGNRKS